MRRRIALALMYVAAPLVELAGYADESVAGDQLLEVMARWCGTKGRPSMILKVEIMRSGDELFHRGGIA